MYSFILQPSFVRRQKLQYTRKYPIGCYGHEKFYFQDLSEETMKLLSQNEARPFAFSLHTESRDLWRGGNDFFIDPEELGALIEILKPLAKNKLGFEWNGTTIVRFTDSIFIYPICNCEYIYMTENERLRLDVIDCVELLGKRLISKDTSILSEIKGNFQDITIADNLVLCNDIMFDYVSMREIQRRKLNLEYTSWENRKYGSVGIHPATEIEKWLLAEICMVWNLKRITLNGQEIFSQQPQQILLEEIKVDIKDVEKSLPPPKAPMNSKSESESEPKKEKKFIQAESSLPYTMLGSELKNFLTFSVHSIWNGGCVCIRIPGYVSENPVRERVSLQNRISRNYSILEKVNPWCKGFRGFVEADLSIYLQVFSPQDMNVALTGDISNYKPIPSSIPGEVIRVQDSNIVRLPDGLFYDLPSEDNIQEKWQRGDFNSPWVNYLLASRQYSSCIL